MIRIDPTVTEMPVPIPWVTALTIIAAVRMARLREGNKNEMARIIDFADRLRSADCLGCSGDAAVQV
ncbi:hypothetical protein LCGC14_2432330 [marine sediment metagenome]|uniref:Uncharacterized protein n=1 Tax=marine sediment metagenome TaxID=412755 RepID=A0A0F9EFJ4_9ZZZZ